MDRKKIADKSLDIKDGDKVRLNINRIQSYKDYYKRPDKYKLWVKSHHNDVFTVELYGDKKVRCTFKEDTTDPKWIFWLGDLIKL